MKKLLTLLVVVLSTSVAAHAQFGIVGGYTSSSTSLSAKDLITNAKNMNLFHIGVAYRAELLPFLVLQPRLTYEVKGANLTEAAAKLTTFSSKSGYVEGAVGIQGGIDLLAFRPFLLVEPFLGFQVTGTDKLASETLKDMQNVKNKLEYGIGLGGGIELMSHLQLSVQWFMNMGKLYKDDKMTNITEALTVAALADMKNYQGVKVTLGLFF